MNGGSRSLSCALTIVAMMICSTTPSFSFGSDDPVYQKCMSELSPNATYAETVAKKNECNTKSRNADLNDYISKGQSVPKGLIIQVVSAMDNLKKECLKTLMDDDRSDALELQCIELTQSKEFQDIIDHQNDSKFFQGNWALIYPLYLKSLDMMSKRHSNTDSKIPQWVRINAKWWSENQIKDGDFIQGIQYLVQQKIIRVTVDKPSESSSNEMPSWIKNNAKWWSDGTISDDDFLKGIQYLVEKGVIRI